MTIRRLAPGALWVLLACAACTRKAPRTSDAPDEQRRATSAKGDDNKHGLTPEQAKQVLVEVGARTITVGDFAERLASQSPYLRARYNSPERRREFLDNMVRVELLAIEAERRGHNALLEVQRVRKQIMVQRMMEQLFDEQGIQLDDVTDAEIEAYYKEHGPEFNRPAQVRASHIVVKTEAEAQEVLKALQAKPKDMQRFRDLAKDKNIDPVTKARFGDLTFFYEDASLPDQSDVPPPVRAAAFALDETGDLHPGVIKTEQGFHILKLTGKRTKLERSLEDAKRLIRNRLWRLKRDEAIHKFVAGLREKADVRENLELLSDVTPKTNKEAAGEEMAPR